MQKNTKTQSLDEQALKETSKATKPKNVFDHIKHIKELKTPDYYKNLSIEEQATFNKYVILMGLSMDVNIIDQISMISKYLDILPPAAFYKVCCDVTPKTTKYCKWIKSSKPKINPTLLSIIAKYYTISKKEAYDYYMSFLQNETQLTHLLQLCAEVGYNEEEIEKFFEEA